MKRKDLSTFSIAFSFNLVSADAAGQHFLFHYEGCIPRSSIPSDGS